MAQYVLLQKNWSYMGSVAQVVRFAEAKRLLDHLVEQIPEEYRESMPKIVRLNREIMEAWEEHGEKAERETEE